MARVRKRVKATKRQVTAARKLAAAARWKGKTAEERKAELDKVTEASLKARGYCEE